MNAEKRRKTVNYILDHDVLVDLVGRRLARKALYLQTDASLVRTKKALHVVKRHVPRSKHKKLFRGVK